MPLILLLAACGGEPRREVTLPAPLPSSPRAVVADAAAPVGHVERACLDPFEGGKPLDTAKLAEIDQSSASGPEKLFARARVHFEAERWVAAAKLFRAIAFEQPDSGPGVYAAQLYLECLNQLGAHAQRSSCFEVDFPRDVPPLRDLYCGARRSTNQEQCELLDRVDLDVKRYVAQKLVERADAGDTALYRKAAEKYAEILRTRCTPATPSSRCDEIAYDAAVAFLAAGDDSAARAIREVMTDPKNKMDKSPLVRKLACRLDGAADVRCARPAASMRVP